MGTGRRETITGDIRTGLAGICVKLVRVLLAPRSCFTIQYNDTRKQHLLLMSCLTCFHVCGCMQKLRFRLLRFVKDNN